MGLAEHRAEAVRAAMARHAWSEAFEQLAAADASELGPRELETFAEVAYMCVRTDLTLQLYERAFAAYIAAGDRRAAARVAFELGTSNMYRRAHAVGTSWARRGEQLLADLPECPEHGTLEWGLSMRAQATGDSEAALAHAERAIAIAKRTGDRDGLAKAQLRKARALVKLARANEAMALIDEAMIAAVADELSPMTTGVVYCMTIDTCNDVFDYTRASEWTDATRRWCERTSVGGFPGICRIHRAEILRLRGKWHEAQIEVMRASDELRAWESFVTVGPAMYELGEIRLRMGDLDAAADAFRQAHELGREPQPGLALLWRAQGRTQAAASLLAQAIAGVPLDDRFRRARMLPAQVEIALAVGDLETARAAADELDGVARDFPQPALEAYAAGARGALHVAEGELAPAIASLRRALQLWNQLDAPYEAACTRVLLAEAYRKQGEHELHGLELRAARAVLERLGAKAVPLSETLEATPASRAPGAAPVVGDVLDDKLELLCLVGGGGMGTVFEARNRRTGRHVAVKVLRADVCGEPAACQRMLQEALACGRIQHPNVVDIYDAGGEASAPYIVMELLRGESLAARIQRESVLPIGESLDIVLQALAGLDAAHRAGIIHRDLKPDNLFLATPSAGGAAVVKVVDFGISKLADNASRLAETKTGMVIGTPYYMSPEQATGSKQIDHRADLYAMGAVLFHAVTGRPPFLADNYNALIAAILTTEPPAPRSLRPEVPAALDAVIARALARDPAARHASAEELAAALRVAHPTA